MTRQEILDQAVRNVIRENGSIVCIENYGYNYGYFEKPTNWMIDRTRAEFTSLQQAHNGRGEGM